MPNEFVIYFIAGHLLCHIGRLVCQRNSFNRIREDSLYKSFFKNNFYRHCQNSITYFLISIGEDGICILTIQDVTRHFDGIVTCQGKNRLGTANCDARLRVRVPPVPPQFEKPLEDRIVTENSAVMFEVDVIGYPEPKVEFFLKGRPLIHGREGVDIKQIEQHYQLTIQNCQIDNHDGEIMAKATNDHGQAESRARLTVEMEEEEYFFNINISNTPHSYTFINLSNNKFYPKFVY